MLGAKGEETTNNSQAYRLRKMIKNSHVSMVAGVILLIMLILETVAVKWVSDKQLENTMYLNQYRLGSKTLTYAVQAYAVTGDRKYYDDYIKELNVDRNRDKAWDGLRKNNIKEKEWEALQEIADMSNGLVPLEEEVMEAVLNGDMDTAPHLYLERSMEIQYKESMI